MTTPTVREKTRHQDGAFREEAAFLPFGSSPLFGVTYTPLQGRGLGLVVCCPILVEFMTNYRHEVLLARTLAANGVAVQRFHYRGAGHSGGDESEASLETMVEDALLASRWLQERTGVGRVAFLGTRWGGLIAGLAALAHPGAPLILWEPVVDAGRYFREVIRGRLVRELKDRRFAAAGADAWTTELEQTGRIDILGYALHRRLHESGRGRRLEEIRTGGSRPVLLIQFGRRNALRPDYLRLTESLNGASRVETRFLREEPAWFWPGHRMKSLPSLVQMTAGWLLAQEHTP
jgi:pimeloyl-ACP methyl ester carboxylesterase